MSRSWRGGKGDANRIKDRKKWDDGWANIDWGKKSSKKKTTSKKSDNISDNSNEE